MKISVELLILELLNFVFPKGIEFCLRVAQITFGAAFPAQAHFRRAVRELDTTRDQVHLDANGRGFNL